MLSKTFFRLKTIYHPKLFAGICLSLLLPAFWGIFHLKVDFDLEKLFSSRDSDLLFYQSFRNSFGSDNDYLLLALPCSPSCYDPGMLERLTTLSIQLGGLEKTKSIQSLLDVRIPINSPMGWQAARAYKTGSKTSLQQDSLFLSKHPSLTQAFFTKDGDNLLFLLQHQEGMQAEDGGKFLTEIQQQLFKLGFEDYQIAGKLTAQKAYIEGISKDLLLFLGLGLLLSIALLWYFFQHWAWVVSGLLLLALSLVGTLGWMSLLGFEINLLSALIPPFLIAVAMADMIHLLNKYYIYRAQEKQDAKKKAIEEVSLATFLTSLTTALGFLSLCMIPNELIQQLAIFTAFGIFLAFLLTFSLIPPLLDSVRIPEKKSSKNKPVLRWYLVSRFKNYSIIIAVFFLILSLWGSTKIRSNNRILEDLPKGHPVLSSFGFFDAQYGGSKPVSLAIILQNKASLKEKELFDFMQALEDRLSTELKLQGIQSLHQQFLFFQQMAFPKKNPNDEGNWQEMVEKWKRVPGIRSQASSLLSKDSTLLRVAGYMPDHGSEDFQKKWGKVEEWLANHEPSTLAVRLTGSTYLIDRSHEQLSEQVLKGFGLALVLVGLVSGILFRSFRMTFLVIFINLLPILMVAGIMGFSGIELKFSTAILFSLAFGIAVDDSLHFIAQFHLHFREGKDLEKALDQVIQQTGPALIKTSLVLLAGFGLLCFSGFGAIQNLGLLTLAALTAALWFDLSLLPIGIHYIYPRTRAFKKNKEKPGNNVDARL